MVGIVNGNGVSVANDTSKTLLEAKFSVVTVEGIVVGNEYANLDGTQTATDAGETRSAITNAGDGQSNYTGTGTFKVATGVNELGRSVSLFVKPSTSAASSSSKGTVIGGVTLSSDNKVVVDSSRDSLATVAKDNKLTLHSTNTMVAQNYGDAKTLTASGVSTSVDGIRGEIRTLIDNDNDGTADYVLFETYALGKITKYSTKDDGSITINGSTSLAYDDKEDVVGFDDVAKGDYVLYAKIGGKLHVQKAESVKGDLDAYNAGKTLTVDGTKTNTSDLAFYSDGGTLVSGNSYATLDKTAIFYLDTKGNIVAVDGTAASSSYAFLVKAANKGGTSDDMEVKVILDDGTTGTYILDGDNSSVFSDGDKNILCTYTLSDDSIALKTVSTSETDNAALSIKKGNATITGVTGAYADDSTVYFYLAPKGTYTASSQTIADNLTVDASNVYVGKSNVSSLTTTTDYIAVKDGSTIKAVVVVTDGIGGSSDYVYLYQRTGRNTNGYLYNVIVDGKMVENAVITTDAGVGLYAYTQTTKGYYKVATPTFSNTSGFEKGNIERLDGDSVIVGGTEYTLTSNSLIANIDGGDTELDAVLNEGDYVAIKYDTDKDILAVYVSLPYDNEQVAVTRNSTVLPSGVTGFDVGEDKITINLANAATINGTTAKTLITIPVAPSGDTIAADFTNADGTDRDDGDTLTITYTTSGKTMVKVYDIVVIVADP